MNSDSFVNTQRFFRTNFNVGRHGAVPDGKIIGNLVKVFRNTASTQDKIGGRRTTVCTAAIVKRVFDGFFFKQLKEWQRVQGRLLKDVTFHKYQNKFFKVKWHKINFVSMCYLDV